MKEQQDKLRLEYEGKLADLERERETIEEEKAQVRLASGLSIVTHTNNTRVLSVCCYRWTATSSCS